MVEAASLADARAAARGSYFDVLLSDIELPDGTGLELMSELRYVGAAAGIAMSGYGSEENVGLSRSAGFALHLTKPVDISALEAAIRSLFPPDGSGGGPTGPGDRPGPSDPVR